MQFVPHRKHLTPPLQSPTCQCCSGENPLFPVRWGYFTTDDQSVSQSVCLGIKLPYGTCEQILLPVRMSKSKLLYDWWSVSHNVLVSSTLVGLATRYYFQSECRSRSYFTTVSQCRAPLWDLRPDIASCQNIAIWNLQSCIYGAPSLTRGRVCNLQCNHSMVWVAQNPKSYFTVSSETPPTWRARFPYLYPPGTEWPSYTPGQWVANLWIHGMQYMYVCTVGFTFVLRFPG
jgi:hypothetical protein